MPTAKACRRRSASFIKLHGQHKGLCQNDERLTKRDGGISMVSIAKDKSCYFGFSMQTNGGNRNGRL